MPSDIGSTLLDALLELDPTSVLLAGGGEAEAAVHAFARRRPAAAVHRIGAPAEVPEVPPGSVGIIGNVVGVWPTPDARRLIAALRDRYCRSILLLAPANEWTLTDYLALGFERLAVDREVELYRYDFDRYNPEREWNTPEHWANPENFKRYRW